MSHRVIFAIAATLYLALSLVCAFVPLALPTTIPGLTLIGPPLLLIWGKALWPLYAGVTLGLATLVVVAVKSTTPELRIMSGWVAAGVWLAGGFLSVSLSV
jgi:hypothetical protein